jgi:hypothetical protein
VCSLIMARDDTDNFLFLERDSQTLELDSPSLLHTFIPEPSLREFRILWPVQKRERLF